MEIHQHLVQMKQKGLIDTAKFSSALRKRGINPKAREVLVTHFTGSKQANDLTLPPNCEGFGRVHHFRRFQGDRWPCNPLPIDPAIHSLGLEEADEIQVQVFQNAVCSWRCWYCFVDFDLLSANPKHSAFKTVDELLDLFVAEENRPHVIDLSGGQPDLVPEWSLWFADALKNRGLDKQIYLWSDDNLSSDFLWRYLASEDIERLSSYPNYGRVGCFKGFDELSFSFNTRADPKLFLSQFKLMKRLVETGFDVYGYATFTSSTDKNIFSLMRNFVDLLQSEVHELFPMRTVPLRIKEYTPTLNRMSSEHYRALEIQEVAVLAWMEELQRRYSPELRNKRIYEHEVRLRVRGKAPQPILSS